MPRAFLVKKTGRVAPAGVKMSPLHYSHCLESFHGRENEMKRLILIGNESDHLKDSPTSEICEFRDVASQVTQDGIPLQADRWRLNWTGSGVTEDDRGSVRGSVTSSKEGSDHSRSPIDPIETRSKAKIKHFRIGSDGDHLTPDPPSIYAPFPLSVIQPSYGFFSAPGVTSCPAFLFESLSKVRLKSSPGSCPFDCLNTEPLMSLPATKDDGPMKFHCSPTKSPDVPFPATSCLPVSVSGPFLSEAPSANALFHHPSAVQRFHLSTASIDFGDLRRVPPDSSPHSSSLATPEAADLSPAPPLSQELERTPEVTYRSRPEAPRFQCEACQKSYSTFNGLSKHKEFHCTTYIKKLFACPHCDCKSYTSLGALKMHIRTHTLPCRCKLCGKAFSRPWLLQGHLRTHTGEKPFECPHCCRAFADRSNLRAHLQTHADIKKYNCRSCSKTFSRMSLLLKHKENCCFGVIR